MAQHEAFSLGFSERLAGTKPHRVDESQRISANAAREEAAAVLECGADRFVVGAIWRSGNDVFTGEIRAIELSGAEPSTIVFVGDRITFHDCHVFTYYDPVTDPLQQAQTQREPDPDVVDLVKSFEETYARVAAPTKAALESVYSLDPVLQDHADGPTGQRVSYRTPTPRRPNRGSPSTLWSTALGLTGLAFVCGVALGYLVHDAEPYPWLKQRDARGEDTVPLRIDYELRSL